MVTPTESAVPLRVFVVDDDPLVLAVTRRVLTRAGYEVSLFEDPRRAAAELSAQPFAVVADLNMPDLDGNALLELVKQGSPLSLRVLYTGDGEAQELAGKLAPGLVHAVLPKAAGMQSLPDTLDRLRREASAR